MTRRNSDSPPRHHSGDRTLGEPAHRHHHRRSIRQNRRRRLPVKPEGDIYFLFVCEKDLAETLRMTEQALVALQPPPELLVEKFRHDSHDMAVIGIADIGQYNFDRIIKVLGDAPIPGWISRDVIIKKEGIERFVNAAETQADMDALVEKSGLMPTLRAFVKALRNLYDSERWEMFQSTLPIELGAANQILVETSHSKVFDDLVSALRKSGLAAGTDFTMLNNNEGPHQAVTARTLVIRNSALRRDPGFAQRLLDYSVRRVTETERGGHGHTP
jgi:hypothetical protein